MSEGFLICEICGIDNESVRFEGSQEKNICDNCLYKIKQTESGYRKKEYLTDKEIKLFNFRHIFR